MSFLLQIVMPRLSWRWLLALSSVPSFVLLLFYGFAPESPRYLCMKGSRSETLQILEKIASLNQTKIPHGILDCGRPSVLDQESGPSDSEDMSPLLSPLNKTSIESKPGFSSFYKLFSPNLIKTTLLLWVLFFGNAFAYYGVILLTSKLSSGQSGCLQTILSYRNSMDVGLYVDTFITSLAGITSHSCSVLTYA